MDIQPLEDDGAQPWKRHRPHIPLMSLPVALGLDGKSALSTQQHTSDNRPSSLPTEGRIGLVWAAGHKPDADARSRSEQRSLPPETLVRVLNQQLGNRWQAGAIQLVNLQQDRPVPQHPCCKSIFPGPPLVAAGWTPISSSHSWMACSASTPQSPTWRAWWDCPPCWC